MPIPPSCLMPVIMWRMRAGPGSLTRLPHPPTSLPPPTSVREFAVPSDRSSTVPLDPLIPTDELEAERRHLRESRAGLRRMREQVLALKVQAPDPVSAAYLEAQLYYRAAALIDNPATPLFFGRLDMTAPEVARHYVGRRHVHDGSGEPLVLDWRAAVSRAFYKASAGDPMGVVQRRRFGFAEGELTAFEDERFDDPGAPHGRSRILTDEIERPRVGPMRDIVATIQPDQDDLVRADLSQTLCIQGAPGTGKTAVGLHRAAYLLYAFRERLARSGVLVVGPNRTRSEEHTSELQSL